MLEAEGPVVCKHAAVRCQQRGVPPEGVVLCVRYGRRYPWHGGVHLFYLGKRQLLRAMRRNPSLRCRWDRLMGTAVIMDLTSRHVLTVFKERDGVTAIRRRYLGKLANSSPS